MNLAIQTTTTRTWKSVKAHYLIAGGVAIVLAAVVATGGWQLATSGGGGAAPAPHVKAAAVASSTTQGPAPVYYLVSSEDQKEALVAAIGAQEIDSQALGAFQVVVATDDETASQVQQMVNDQTRILVDTGQPEIKVVDLRGPAQ